MSMMELSGIRITCTAEGCRTSVELPLNRLASTDNVARHWPCEHFDPAEFEVIADALKQLAALRGRERKGFVIELAAGG